MIDTKEHIGTRKLKLVSIDFDHFNERNLPILERFLKEESKRQHASIDFNDYSIGIDQTATIHVSPYYDTDNNDLYGVNDTIKVAKKDQSFSDWAKLILEHYNTWLRKQYATQQNATPSELATMLRTNNKKHSRLFTANSYIDFILYYFKQLTGKDINIAFIQWQHSQAYFNDALLIATDNLKTINNSMINLLQDYCNVEFDVDNKIIYKKKIIFTKIYHILTGQNKDTTVIPDEKLNYPSLLYRANSFDLHSANINMPLQNLANLTYDAIASTKTDRCGVNFVINDDQDIIAFLQQTVKAIFNKRASDMLNIFIRLDVRFIPLTTKQYQIVEKYIGDLNSLLGKANKTIINTLTRICEQVFI